MVPVQPTVPIEVDPATGVWSTDGMPMLYMPRHFFLNHHLAMERELGRDSYSKVVYEAGLRSARTWCENQWKTAGTGSVEMQRFSAPLEVMRHYLTRLSQRGWGQFTLQAFDLSAASAEIFLSHSAFVLGVPNDGSRLCYLFAGWFAGASDWVLETSGSSAKTCCAETQCAAQGHEFCAFSVYPDSDAK